MVTVCRHHSINSMFTTQYSTAIPPTIRNNVRLWVVFNFSNSERLLKHVYPEISNLVKEKKFLELYEHSTNNDHDSLIIINHNDMEKNYRIRKNLNIQLNRIKVIIYNIANLYGLLHLLPLHLRILY